MAKDAWQWWQDERNEKERRAELEAIVRAEGEQLRQQIEQIVRQVAGNQPAHVQEAIRGYLSQLPAAIRRSLRRPEDPTGTTVPLELAPRKADDLLRLLPARLPKFKSGAQPLPGVDRVLDSLLGVGGFGEVWKAHNPHMSSFAPVALKFCLDPIAARALQNETMMIDRVMRAGNHPGMVGLLNTYLNAQNPCLEYEYVEGGDLGGLILEWHRRVQGVPTPAEAAKVMLRLSEIVAAAHQANIVHRDLKPANILTVKGANGATQFKIADFGIGGVATRYAIQESQSGSRARMQVSAVQGSYTPLYASPQQMKGEPADPRDDVYSLGVIWHQLLTGDWGMGSPSGSAWKRKLSEKGMTPELLTLLESCFEQETSDRPADAGVLSAKLTAALTPKPAKVSVGQGDKKEPPVVPLPIPRSTAKTPKTTPWLSYAIGAVVVMVVGWLGVRQWSESGNTTLPATATTAPAVAAPAANVNTALPQNPNPGDGWTEQTSSLEFVFVPAGEFTMGSNDADPQANRDEKPQHKASTSAYWIGKTEVTNAQFRQFVDGGGYSDQSLWTTAGWQWHSDNNVTRPHCWDNTDLEGENQPVVCVSWYEAMAYANWLQQKTGLQVRLPTEAEWEKAARGPDGNIYPWGNEWNAALLNATGKEDGYEYTAPVGSFPEGKSFYNALDMAGNVWEWNSTLDKEYPYRADDGRENSEAEGGRLLRGGGWNGNLILVRGTFRYRNSPDNRDDSIGFRVVVALSPGG